MKKLTNEELNKCYDKSEECDKSVFNEMKSNVLLVSGEHYRKTEGQNRDRNNTMPSDGKQKVRITKNLIQRVTSKCIDGIMSLSPDLKVFPANASELQDKKAAELNDAVLTYGKNRYKLNELKEDWCADFVEIAEVACKIYFDPMKGDLKGYKQKVDESGAPLFRDQTGALTTEAETFQIDPMTGMMAMDQVTGTPLSTKHEPEPDKDQPVFSGDFCFEGIFPADLLRCPEAERMDDSPYLIYRKMMDQAKAKRLIPEDDPEREAKLGFIKKSADENFKVFDQNTHTFEDSNGRVLIREHYYRPCYDYPNGYYYIQTEFGILAEGELPFGIFPIAWRAYKKKQTTPRGTGKVKIARPYQVELNRASSKEIEHQLIHGDDKIVTPPGGKMTQEAVLPGLRHYKAIGAAQIIPGRVGDQFRPYIKDTTEELFFAVDEDSSPEETNGVVDPVALLYRSIRRNKKYGRAAREFQAFVKDVYWIYLQLAKQYFNEDRFIKAVGRNEAINMAEFKATDPLSVQIKLIENNEDSDTLIGKYMILQQTLQYVGKDLPKESLGMVLSNMPFANSEMIFKRLTLDSKNVENDILAMDRGEMRPAEQDDNHDLYIQELTARIKSPDFRLLSPDIQTAYKTKRDQHRAIKAQQAQELLMTEQKFIPMGGNFVKVDMYEMNEQGKQERATFPDESLKWLREKLTQQGMGQQRLESMDMADQVAIAHQINQAQQQMPMQNQGGMNGPTNGSF